MQFSIPAFAGTVRVMAVAWSKDKVGKASGDVIVRDPVVLTATLPRFLRTGDKGAARGYVKLLRELEPQDEGYARLAAQIDAGQGR